MSGFQSWIKSLLNRAGSASRGTLGSSVLARDNFTPEELDIRFSASLKSIAFAFATNDGGNPTAVTNAASGPPEGQLSFTNLFDAVAITDTAPSNFGVA